MYLISYFQHSSGTDTAFHRMYSRSSSCVLEIDEFKEKSESKTAEEQE